jgi:uncharacterized protein (DUF305 family)
MKNPLGSVGLVLFGMTLGGVAMAQQAADPNAQMHAITGQLQTKLGSVTAKSPDKVYVDDMAAISPAIIRLCKMEIKYGKMPQARAEADKLLTVQQEYDAQIQEMDRLFNIQRSP